MAFLGIKKGMYPQQEDFTFVFSTLIHKSESSTESFWYSPNRSTRSLSPTDRRSTSLLYIKAKEVDPQRVLVQYFFVPRNKRNKSPDDIVVYTKITFLGPTKSHSLQCRPQICDPHDLTIFLSRPSPSQNPSHLYPCVHRMHMLSVKFRHFLYLITLHR